MKKEINIAIIGYGNIGKKRLNNLLKIKKFKIIIKYIIDIKKPKNLSKKIIFLKDWRKIITSKLDLIIIATPTKIAENITEKLCGKFNLLIEKPITTKENLFKKIIKISNQNDKILKVGYNLRYDTGIAKAKELISKIGNIYYIKISYANGVAKTNTNNVGSVIDMGTHSINLIEFFINKSNIKVDKSISQKNEFLKKSKIDNGFSILKHNKILIFMHHGFCTWKNDFNLEISGSNGFVRVDSLPKWGRQTVSLGIRKYPSGIPKIKNYYFYKDMSWKNELTYVLDQLFNNKKNIKLINNEGLNTIKIINNIQLN
jgi:predicted dehydrogenase